MGTLPHGVAVSVCGRLVQGRLVRGSCCACKVKVRYVVVLRNAMQWYFSGRKWCDKHRSTSDIDIVIDDRLKLRQIDKIWNKNYYY